MSIFQVINLFPRPVRDIGASLFDIRSLSKTSAKVADSEEILQSEEGKKTIEKVVCMLKGAFHLGFLSITWFVISPLLGWSNYVIGTVSAIFSPSSMLIAGSFYGLSLGARSLLYSLGTGSLWQFATLGIGRLGICYFVLEWQECFEMGSVEEFIDFFAKERAPSLTLKFLEILNF